jgi:hypothetical protein
MLLQDPTPGTWIIAIIGAVAFFVMMLVAKRLFYPRKKQKITQQTKEYLTEKFDDLLALRAILVTKRDSGVLLFSYVIECEDNVVVKSPDFLSGVVHAIQCLGKEIGFKDQFSRLVYGNYQIIASPGQYCTVILVSRTDPSSEIARGDNLYGHLGL